MVDDERAIRELISEVLNIAGFEVISAVDGLDALNQIRKKRFDLILLDVNLPKVDGFTVLERVRESAPTQPIIMLSARTEKDDVTRGLRLGADDYIRKPFSVEELTLRVQNRLRREMPTSANKLIFGPITVDEQAHKVLFEEGEIELSPTEFNLDRKSTRLNSSHMSESRMPSSA